MTDISGIRIILYYTDQIEIIDKIIRKNFYVDEANTIDKKTVLDTDQFGYLSYHYVIKINDFRSQLPEWDNFKNFTAEIQVRTVMQHAWAAISHQLEYKKGYEIPSPLRRKLFRLAGLVELADEEFQVVRDQHNAVAKAIMDKKSIGNLNIYEELNLNTVINFFAENKDVRKKIEDYSKSVGFLVHPIEKDVYFSQITYVLQILDLKYLEDLEKILKTAFKNGVIYLQKIFDATGFTSWGTDISFSALLLILRFLNEKQRKEFFAKHNWDTSFRKFISNGIENFNKLHLPQ